MLKDLRGISDDELLKMGLDKIGHRRKVRNGINDRFHLWDDGKQTKKLEEMEKEIHNIENRGVAPLI